jgi:hypothetical protein
MNLHFFCEYAGDLRIIVLSSQTDQDVQEIHGRLQHKDTNGDDPPVTLLWTSDDLGQDLAYISRTPTSTVKPKLPLCRNKV